MRERRYLLADILFRLFSRLQRRDVLGHLFLLGGKFFHDAPNDGEIACQDLNLVLQLGVRSDRDRRLHGVSGRFCLQMGIILRRRLI